MSQSSIDSEASYLFFRGATYDLKGIPVNRCKKSTSRSSGKLTCSSKIMIFGTLATATAHTCDLSKVKTNEFKKAEYSATKRNINDVEFGRLAKNLDKPDLVVFRC